MSGGTQLHLPDCQYKLALQRLPPHAVIGYGNDLYVGSWFSHLLDLGSQRIFWYSGPYCIM